MKQISQSYRTGALRIVDVPQPPAGGGRIRVDTRASLISSGTERATVEVARKSLVGKALDRPDLVRKVVDKVRREGPLAAFATVLSKLDLPIPLGYSLAGVVSGVGSGVTEFWTGQRVACAGAGWASHAEANVIPTNLAVAIPDAVTDEEAAFVTVGAIALQGVRLAEITLGCSVVIIGLGLLGQLAVQLAAAHGADVIAVDIVAAKVKQAMDHGARSGVVIGEEDLRASVLAATFGRGADAILITASASTNAPLVQAGEIARDRARVVVVGAMPLEIPRKDYYEKELSVVVSRSYGPGRYDPSYEERGNDYPIGYVRWTQRRNLEAVLAAIAARRLDVRSLITHRFRFEDVLEAYELIAGDKPAPHMGVLLTYGQSGHEERVVAKVDRSRTATGIGVLGTGNFAQSVLLPKLAKIAPDRLAVCASGRGLSARHAADKFGFTDVASSLDEVLSRSDVGSIVIATRHAAHASQVARALRAGKNVFVEKPLAIDRAGLDEVRSAYEETDGLLMVGFNRRFAPYAARAREFFAQRRTGLVMTAHINAGYVPPSSWVAAAEEGGRVVGEGCHFVDLMSYWAGAPVCGVTARGIRSTPGAFGADDNAILLLSFEDGSIGTLTYTAMGDPSLPKESYVVHCEGTTVHIDDWRSLSATRGGKTKTSRGLIANKGHEEELRAFVDAVDRGGRASSPISWSSLEATTAATLVARDLLSRDV